LDEHPIFDISSKKKSQGVVLGDLGGHNISG
jgi:hypothetical protein